MFPGAYFPKTYFAGTYFPPTIGGVLPPLTTEPGRYLARYITRVRMEAAYVLERQIARFITRVRSEGRDT